MKRRMDLKELLVRVAELYYMEGLTQEAIAQMLDLSRPQVSRYLKRARELGIVEIRIMSPLLAVSDQRDRLSHMFSLPFVTVVSTVGEDPDWVQDRFGLAVAETLEQMAKEDAVVGFGPGQGIYHAVRALTPNAVYNVTTLGLVGQDERPDAMYQPNQLAGEAAVHWHARWIPIPAPARLASVEERGRRRGASRPSGWRPACAETKPQ